jgi:replication-associated recombination protein RarA
MTKKEQTARSAQLLELSGADARRALQRIHDILWPAKDPDREWSPDTLEDIAQEFSALLPPEPTTRLG